MATHSTLVGYLLWFFFGLLGMHRFYFGKRNSGALYFVTLGVIGVGWLVDLFLIAGMRRETASRYQAGRYNYSVAWLLLLPLGVLGAHRFYMRRWGTGLLYLCTLGVFGLGVIYDVIVLNDLLSEQNEAWITGAPELRGRSVR